VTTESGKHAKAPSKTPLTDAVVVQQLILEASLEVTGRPGVIQSFMQYIQTNHPMAYRGLVNGLIAEARGGS
jgi:hypothetical protein